MTDIKCYTKNGNHTADKTKEYLSMIIAIIKVYGYNFSFDMIKNDLVNRLNSKIDKLNNMKTQTKIEINVKNISVLETFSTDKLSNQTNNQLSEKIKANDHSSIPHMDLPINSLINNGITTNEFQDFEISNKVTENQIEKPPLINNTVDEPVKRPSNLEISKLDKAKVSKTFKHDVVQVIKVEEEEVKKMPVVEKEDNEIKIDTNSNKQGQKQYEPIQNNYRLNSRIILALQLLNLEYGKIDTILSFNTKKELIQSILKNLKFNDFLIIFRVFAWINQNPISLTEYKSKHNVKENIRHNVNNHHSVIEKDEINKLLLEIIFTLLDNLFEKFKDEKSLDIANKNNLQFQFINDANNGCKKNVVELISDEFFKASINLIKFKEFNLYNEKFDSSLNDSYFKFGKSFEIFKKFIIGYFNYFKKSTRNGKNSLIHILLKIIRSKFEILEFAIFQYFQHLKFEEKKKPYLLRNSKKSFVKNYNKRRKLFADSFNNETPKCSNFRTLMRFLNGNHLRNSKHITKICFKNLKFLIDCEFQIIRFLINDIIIEKNLLKEQKNYKLDDLQHLKNYKINVISYLILLNDPRLLINFNLIKWNQLGVI